MWRDLYELAKRLLGISEELQRNRADIKELQQEMRLVSGAVQQLHFEIQSIRDELRNTVKNEQQARENALLRIENRPAAQ